MSCISHIVLYQCKVYTVKKALGTTNLQRLIFVCYNFLILLPLTSEIKAMPCKITKANVNIRMAFAIISRTVDISLNDVKRRRLLKCFIFHLSSKTAWAMPGIELPCLLEVGDISAPVATKSTFFKIPLSICFKI